MRGAALAAALLILAACAGSAPVEPTRIAVETAQAPIPSPKPPADSAQLERFEFKQIVMAIEARIVLYAPDEATAKAAAKAAFAELDRADAIFSDYRMDSIVAKINEATQREPVRFSLDSGPLAMVFLLAEHMRTDTDGAFDVSAGPVVACWRETRRTGELPAADALEAARQAVGGWSFVESIGDTGVAVVQARQGARFDFGGIAKGYAVGQAVDVARNEGASAVLLEMGGDVVVQGAPPGEPGWQFAVDTASGAADIVLPQGAVSVSGDASQFVEIDGVRYSHVVDPRSGWALSRGLGAAVVLPWDAGEPAAEQAALCDALSTAVTILGPHEGRALANRFGAAVIRITDPAFTSLFDGTSLTGWTPRGGHYDGDAVWTVEDGCITGRTGADDAGGLLYTATPHTSFEVQCEVQLDYPFDSGIFVRMAPEGRGLQLTLDDRPDGEVGGVYSDGWIQHAHPRAAAAWRRGEWNHVFVRCTGFDMRLEAWINGVLVMDRFVPQDFGADGQPAFAPRGLIGLQVHGGGSEGTGNAVRFRDLQVRDLPVFGDAWATDRGLSPPEREARAAARAADGWRDLFAGPDPLAAWEAVDGEAAPRVPADYAVQDGLLSVPSAPPAGYLRTREDFRDFDLRFEFRQARMSNSGLFLRGRRESTGPDGAPVPGGNPAYSGCEIQLLDDWNWEAVTNSQLEPWQFTGSLYGAVPPLPGLLAPIGEWNTLEVRAIGNRLACALNGQTLWDVDTAHLAADPPFAQRAVTGFIGLQRYAAPDVAGAEALGVREMYVRSR